MTDLEDLARARLELNEWVRLQPASILHFWDKGGFFHRTLAALKLGQSPAGSGMTTTLTCLESLLEVPDWIYGGAREGLKPQVWALTEMEQFLADKLAANAKEIFKSDGAARVYCRVRALGSYLRLVADRPPAMTTELVERVGEAWSSRYDGGGSFGLREATFDEESYGWFSAPQVEASDQQYPANAYLTYWGLLARAGLARHGLLPAAVEPESGAHRSLDDRSFRSASAWMVENLGTQLALHYAESPLADPQQLAWSICGVVRFARPEDDLANAMSVHHVLVVAGLKAFFAQQGRSGDWPVGSPLFHYKNAGNAYSYIYELLGELLATATASDDQVPAAATAAFRAALRPYWPHLRLSFQRAADLGQRVSEGVCVWSSGHHPHRTAESWATASVFRYLQGMRRLVGVWCREEAKRELGARRARSGSSELRTRGGTWDLGEGGAGAFLSTAFLWPERLAREERDGERRAARRLYGPDPDEPIFNSKHARSAILYGPPGTGKTTLVEALAGSLGWDFVEVTPAQFLDHGVDHVSARADQIFRQVMELDRCVVLLDEIDELIQFRGSETDPLERFFTTTMLPRLAKLWDQSRVLFFVNTNDISRVDNAIRRSQRFDAAVLVLPTGFEVKKLKLLEAGFDLEVSEATFNSALLEHPPAYPSVLGWFALVRYDQIDSLIGYLKAAAADVDRPTPGGSQTPVKVDVELLSQALIPLAGELSRLDWLAPRQPPGAQPVTFDGAVELPNLGALLNSQRRDISRERVCRVLRVQSGDHPEALDVEAEPALVRLPPDGSAERALAGRGLMRPDGNLVLSLQVEP